MCSTLFHKRYFKVETAYIVKLIFQTRVARWQNKTGVAVVMKITVWKIMHFVENNAVNLHMN